MMGTPRKAGASLDLPADPIPFHAPSRTPKRSAPGCRADLEQADHVGDWRAFLSAEDDAEVRLLRRRTRTGRPCGGEVFVRGLESLLARSLRRRKPGPEPKKKGMKA